MDFITEYRGRFGVEPICTVLSEHGCSIAPSTYYDNLHRRPSRRTLRDEQIVALMDAERQAQKLVKRFGARKMCLHLRSRGHDVARCTIERLYREQGWEGVLRGRAHRTTIPDDSHDRPADLVGRDFVVDAPNLLGVGPIGVEVAFRVVRWPLRTGVGAGGDELLTAPDSTQSVGAHDPFHPARGPPRYPPGAVAATPYGHR